MPSRSSTISLARWAVRRFIRSAQALDIRPNVLRDLKQALRCVVVKPGRVAHHLGDVFKLGCDVLIIVERAA
jgi:hypothetical protein